jgi:hypothetical protein
VNGRYYFGSRGGARPFIGGNVGPHLVKRRVDVGLYTISEDTWHLGLAPEVGVVVPLGPVVKGFINAKYNITTSAGDAGLKHSYFGLNIGFAWAGSGGM